MISNIQWLIIVYTGGIFKAIIEDIHFSIVRSYLKLVNKRDGLYSSGSRGKWMEYEYLCRLAPDGWEEKHEVKAEETVRENETCEVIRRQVCPGEYRKHAEMRYFM